MGKEFCGSVIVPGSRVYNKARQIFNRSIQKYPASIMYCEDENAVIRAVQAAGKTGHTVRVRSGGHNYEGFSVGNCAEVIDVSCMNTVTLDEASGTLTAGPGVLNSALYETMGAYGYPFPSGTCPTVAVAALTQGGGWGLSARMFGLTCDSLVSATLIDACGQRHTADAAHEQELFFALRGGGGGNFGVVTSLTYRLPPKLFQVTYVEIGASCVSKAIAAEFIICLQQWLLMGDRRFTPLARVYHTPEEPRGLILRGIFYGGKSQARASLAAFLSLGLDGVLKEMTFLQAIRIVEAGYPPYERFTTGGRFAYAPFSIAAARRIVSLIDELAGGSMNASVSLYGLGGAVAAIAPDETAFFYRRAINILALSTDWEDPAAKGANLAWFTPRYRMLEGITFGSYVNFPNLENRDYMRAYYGGNAGRLRCIKGRIDPENLFCFSQSIR
jgi:hypothetical protein